MKVTLLVTLILSSCSVFAASGNVIDWSGFYVGGNVGYGSGHKQDKSDSDAWGESFSGINGGLQVGHNWQYNNNFVLGVVANLSLSDMSDDYKNSDNQKYDPYDGSVSIKQNGSVDLMLGYAFDEFMPYVKTGISVAKEEYSLGCHKNNTTITTGCKLAEFESSESNISAGLNIGAGFQYEITNNLSAGIEYTYVDLGSSSVYLHDPNYPTHGSRNFNTSYSTTTLNVNYLF